MKDAILRFEESHPELLEKFKEAHIDEWQEFIENEFINNCETKGDLYEN